MKFFLVCLIFLSSCHVFANETSSDAFCESKTTALTIFSKNDFTLNSQLCKNNDRSYNVHYLQNKTQNIFVKKQYEEMGYDAPNLKAVSIFNKDHLPPLLILLHSERICCYPSPEGETYAIDLYKTIKSKNTIQLQPYTTLLAKNSYGFEGQNNVREKVHFKFKDIASIKKWLEKNYK